MIRKLKALALSLTTLVLLALSFTTVSAYEDVSITSFDISITIDENAKMQVDQNIDTYFNISKHGIYAYIPQRYDMTWNIDGSSIDKSYYFPVNNIQVYGDPASVDIDGYGNVVIQIGDADVYVNGPKSYHYSYDIQMRDLDLDGQQALYFNIVGDGWDMSMAEVNFSITLPKEWPSDIQFYSGYYGTNADADVSYSINGNTLSGTVSGGLARNNALTIYAPLANDYFTFIPAPDYTLAALAIFSLISIITILLFFRFGKDEKAVEVVEFYPIEGLSSAQVGYIYEGVVDTRDVVSLIIEWAYKGYLSITEEDSKSKDFVLTKIKDISESEIRAEITLFDKLFKNRDTVTSEDLKNTFYRSVEYAKQDIQRHFIANKERRIFDNKATAIKVLLAIFSMLPVGLVVGATVYANTYEPALSFASAAISVGISIVLMLAWIIAVKFWPSLRKWQRSLSTFGLILFSALYILISFVLLSIADLAFWKILILYLLIATNIGFISVMDKRTELGTKYLGHILGLKNFIEVAEKDKLEMLIHDDPSYFYRILPYAYVLNVSDTWSKKFENIVIEQPDWYVGNHPLNTYIFVNHLNRTLGNMSRAMTSVPQAKAHGGGGFGGGGGGFSGGGFGGGGGSSW